MNIGTWITGFLKAPEHVAAETAFGEGDVK
jgi:hypothetical protein